MKRTSTCRDQRDEEIARQQRGEDLFLCRCYLSLELFQGQWIELCLSRDVVERALFGKMKFVEKACKCKQQSLVGALPQ